MALETPVTVIADLVTTNPAASDQKSQGDDHIRNIKTALRQSFAGFTGAVVVTGTDGGAVNAYTLTPTTALLAYGTKMVAIFSPSVTNTTTTPTLSISGLAAKTIKSVANAALTAGDLVSGSVYAAVYDGTNFLLLSVTKNYADQLAMTAALPAQSLGFLRSNGSVAAFTTTHTGYPQNEDKGADIASAATINLTTATGNLVHVTGTTTITAITIPSGADRTVVFDDALTLTHHSTTLILPGGANITTAAGDVMVVRGDGSGNARVISYQQANGASRFSPGEAKAWIKCNAAGAIQASHNVTSITDNGTGDVTVTIATDFSSADYCVIATVLANGFQSASVAAQAAGSVQVKNWSVAGGLNDVIDPTNYYIACLGTSV